MSNKLCFIIDKKLQVSANSDDGHCWPRNVVCNL